MPDDPEDVAARKMATVAVAALLFAASDDWTDSTMDGAFSAAERFVAAAEKRYGKLDLAG